MDEDQDVHDGEAAHTEVYEEGQDSEDVIGGVEDSGENDGEEELDDSGDSGNAEVREQANETYEEVEDSTHGEDQGYIEREDDVEEQPDYQTEVGELQADSNSPESDAEEFQHDGNLAGQDDPNSPVSDTEEFQNDDNQVGQDVYETQEEVTVGDSHEEVTVEHEDYGAEEVAGEQENEDQKAGGEFVTEEVTDDQENEEYEPQDDFGHQEYDGVEAAGGEQYVSQEEVTNSEDVSNQEEITQQADADPASQEEVPNAAAGEWMGDSVQVDDNQDNQDVATSRKNDSEEEEDDFDNVVEVEEHQAESDVENENIARHVSDSEYEDNAKEDKLGDVSEDDLRGASSGSENEASEDDNNVSPTKKRNAIVSSDEEEQSNKTKSRPDNNDAVLKMFDSDSEDEQKEDGVGDLIADIFGESDDEEEFTGFGQEEILSKKSKAKSLEISDESDVELAPADDRESEDEDSTHAVPKKKTVEEDSESDDGVRDTGGAAMSDFDLMMQRKKEESRKRSRRKDGGTFISDADDIINAMLTKMKEAAEADRDANQKRKPALSKLKMLPVVVAHLKKQDLKEAFVDNGVIAAIADWLSLLPDRSLPHITIRTELLKILHDLPPVSAGTLKQSGIGKSVMILFKHPREIRTNKDSAGRLINKWSRPIFGLNENFKSMSREEREQRDLEQMPQAKRRRLSSGAGRGQAEEGRGEGELGHLRPGELGFVMRARVPMPSTKDYVVRPKWNVEASGPMDDEDEPARLQKRRRSAGAPRSSKKDERLEKHMKNFAERKKHSKMQRAVKISIEGNKMSIL